MAKIKYNGEVIAEVLSGQSALLRTSDFELKGDLEIDGYNEAPLLQDKTTTENGTVTADEGYDGLSSVTVNVPIPEPEGEIEITENGIHDVAGYASANVAVPMPEGDALGEFLKVRDGYHFCNNVKNITTVPMFDTSTWTTMEYAFYNCRALTEVPLFDTSNVTNMGNMFAGCSSLTTVPLFNTSKVTSMSIMFRDCSSLTTVPLFDTSNVTSMGYMFNRCTVLTEVPLFDTSKVTSMSNMFYECYSLTEVPLFDTSNVTNMDTAFGRTAIATVPLFDTGNVTNMNNIFYGCSLITHIPLFNTSKVTMMISAFYNCYKLLTVADLDVRACTNFSSLITGCSAVTYIGFRNIKANLQVGSGTSWGHLLTVDSLVHLIYELRNTGSTRTLTVGSANLEKLANVYVKLVDITDEMRAEDDLIDEKHPFVVCESTDDGAMLITDYATTIKNWTIK